MRIICGCQGGIIFGPSVLGHRKEISHIQFPVKDSNVFETTATFSLVFFLFSVGVKMNAGRMLKPDRRTVTIGISVFFFTLALPECLVFDMMNYLAMDETLKVALPCTAGSQCISSSLVVACLLAELKLMNTDLGQPGPLIL